MGNVAQRSFAAGELAPSLYARTDVQKYQTGLRTLRNFVIRKHGGVQNRAGSLLVAEVKDSTQPTRLLKFVFNDDQTYVLEFGDLYMRVVRNGAPVVVAGVTAWSGATNYVVGDLASRLGVNYYATAAHINQQPPNASYWYPFAGDIYEIPTPYLAADLPDLHYAQSADVITLVHPSYAPRELRRTANTTWVLALISFGPSIATPDITSTVSGGGGGNVWFYAVTAVAADTYEESVMAIDFNGTVSATIPTGNIVNWAAVASAVEYNVYRMRPSGYYGFIGTTTLLTFTDPTSSSDDDTSIRPPAAPAVFASASNYPRAVSYYQQRRLFGGTNNDPEKVWASRIGLYNNFATSFPLQDDDSLSFTLAGEQVNAVRHLKDVGRLLVFTGGPEMIVEGDTAGILRPGEVNPRVLAKNGTDEEMPPLVADSTVLFMQARGSTVRSLLPGAVRDYSGTDMTVYAAHLFQGFEFEDWDYQHEPHSVVLACRDDGVLLGLTFLPEHDTWGWHHHDTDGRYEAVVSVPEGTEDAVYTIVNRTIDGDTKRYIERSASREFDDITDAIFVDCGLSYDGTNTSATLLTLSGGATWEYSELLTVTADTGVFTAGDVGNAIEFTDDDGGKVRVALENYTSSTVMTGRASRTVPAELRHTATTVWARAVDVFTGLDHLEGKAVAVFADGYVAASPNNPAFPTMTVASGSIALDALYVKAHVGLPYLSDLETLDIDTPAGKSLKSKRMLVNTVRFFLERSRGVWAGRQAPTGSDATEKLREFKARRYEALGEPTSMVTDDIRVIIKNNWNSHGRVFLRQVDPLPLAVLSVTPQGYL